MPHYFASTAKLFQNLRSVPPGLPNLGARYELVLCTLCTNVPLMLYLFPLHLASSPAYASSILLPEHL